MIIIDNDEKNDSSYICKKPNSSKNNISSYEYKIEDNNSSYICNPYDIDKNDTTKKDSNLNRKNQQNPYKIIINKPEENNKIIMRNKIINKFSNNNLNLEINDEIYPDELFNLDLFDEKKPNNQIKERNIISNNININHKPVLSDGVYINNLNIIGTNYLGSSSESNKGLQEKIKKLEFDLKQKKRFVTLEISSSESTMEIKSSYENINEISSNKYIYDNDLRDMTKKFIIKKSKLPNKVLISSFDKNKRHSSIALENYSNLKNQIISNKNKSTKNGMNALTKVNINKDNIQKEEISVKNENIQENDIIQSFNENPQSNLKNNQKKEDNQ
jgi:hypothetical protein